jgi:hypothetical protein
MTYAYIVADYRFGFLIGAVNHRSVLYVNPVAYGNGMHIAPNHGIEPYAAFIAHGYFANDGSIVGYVAIPAELRMDSANRFDKCHVFFSG